MKESKKAKRKVNAARRNKIIHYVSAVLGLLILVAGFLDLVIASDPDLAFMCSIFTLIPLGISILLELNVVLLRPTKRGRIEGAIFAAGYLIILLIGLFAEVDLYFYSLFPAVGYIALKAFRIAWSLWTEREGKKRIVFSIVTLLIAGGLITFACFNYSNLTTLFSFIGFFFIIEGFGHILLSIASGFDGKKLVRVMVRTHAGEILLGLLLVLMGASVALFYAEDGMGSFGDALWYCFCLVTTIGLGDFTSVTFLGRVISVIVGIYGIIVVAVITSVIVNMYGESEKERQEKQALQQAKEDGEGAERPVEEAEHQADGATNPDEGVANPDDEGVNGPEEMKPEDK